MQRRSVLNNVKNVGKIYKTRLKHLLRQRALNVDKAVVIASCIFLESLTSIRRPISSHVKSAKRRTDSVTRKINETRAES